MKDKQRLVSLFYFNDNIAGKDMFLVPKYLANELGMQAEIVFPIWEENSHLKGKYRGVKLTPIKSKSRFDSTFWSEKEILWWLIQNASKIDVLSLFWLNKRNVFFACIYKFLNPNGVCYIKGDISSISSPVGGKLKRLNTKIKHFFYQFVDILSVETQDIFSAVQNGALGKHFQNQVILMPNGFDNELLSSLGITKKNFQQKDKIAITVGRIGHPDKNNEMMLKALEGVRMNGWQFWFIGPVEKHFEKKIEEFLGKELDKSTQIKLLGAIYDRKKLWEIYNQAKVFVLTSPKECMAQVFSEALAFGDYIITTNVQGAKEITNNQTLGKIVGIADVELLNLELQKIFDDDSVIEMTLPLAHKLSDEKYNWSRLTRDVAIQIQKKKKGNV